MPSGLFVATTLFAGRGFLAFQSRYPMSGRGMSNFHFSPARRFEPSGSPNSAGRPGCCA